MEKEIFEVIRSLSNFDGVYYEKFLQKYIPFEKGKDIIRVIISDGNVIVHVFSEDTRKFYDLERLWKDGKEIELNF